LRMTGLWFLDDLARLRREREAIRELEERASWLQGASWSYDGALVLDAVLIVDERDYAVRMTYPDFFPTSPPYVRPMDPDARWSGHQYGSGTLCLEWGPDNWDPDVTGSQMLESAYRLLCLEGRSLAAGEDLVPSRHALSTGQTLRPSTRRHYYSAALRAYLASLPVGAKGKFDFTTHWQGGECGYLVQQVQVEGGPPRQDEAI